MVSGFVRSLDVEGQTSAPNASEASSRRAFGLGVLAGGVACAGLAAIALFQVPSSGNVSSGLLNAFAPTGYRPAIQTNRQHASLEEVQHLIKQVASAKEGSAIRSTVDMLAKSKAGGSFCYGLPGALPPAGNFDPFGFTDTDEATVRRYREAELKHGRVSMLASLGFITQEGFHPFFGGDAFDKKPALQLLGELPPALIFGVTLGIGICETISIEKGWEKGKYELKKGYVNGDLDWDPLGLKPKDAAEFRKKQTIELQNGRLAMLAAAGFILQEVQQGTTFSQSSIFQEIGNSGVTVPGN